MAGRIKSPAVLISMLIMIMIQSRDLSAEKMTEAPDVSDSMELQTSLIVNLDEKEFMEFVKSPAVRIVYFSTTNFSGLKNFLTQLESSAKLLFPFGVKIGKVDCRTGKVPDYCTQPEVHQHVYAFKNGGELLELMLVNMFDVNSIMSNILQLVLLKEVPILQTKEERIEFEDQNKGKFDVAFSFQRSIGTYEHRTLMEIAHGYHGQFAFALTTEEVVIDDLPDKYDDEDVAIWIGRCHAATKDTACQYTKYYDAMDSEHLASFLRLVNIQLLHDVSSSKVRNPLRDFDVHVAVLYYDKALKESVSEVGKDVYEVFKGSVGVITVDLDSVDGKKYGFVKDITTMPNLAIFMKNEQEPHYLETPLSSESAIRFVKAELEVYRSKLRKKQPSLRSGTEELDELAAVEKQDDAVAGAVFQLRGTPINRDHVPALTDKTFPQETGSRDVYMVMYYLEFDPRSMAFMRSYSEAAEILAKDGVEPLAAVDCYDWTDVCGKQNITSYPTIRIFQKGQGYTTYNGPLDTKAVTATVKLLLSPAPLVLKSESDVDEFIAGNIPSGIGELTPISVLGLFSAKHEKEQQAFMDASVSMHGKYLTGYAAADWTENLLKSYNMKGLGFIVFNREDPYRPYIAHEGVMTSEKIVGAIENAVLPVLPELTPLTFPNFFAKGQPLAILFAKGNGDDDEKLAMKTMSELSLGKGDQKLVYCWMMVDAMNPLNVGRHVLMDYNSAAVAPALSVVNHATGNIYNYPSREFKKESVKEWVKSILDGSIAASKMLADKEWKPLNPGYDFLAMIDQGNEKQSERDRLFKAHKDKVSDNFSDDIMDMENDDEMAYIQEEGSVGHMHTEL